MEGDSATVIENKPTNSAAPLLDYFSMKSVIMRRNCMAVMAAQARSLGFDGFLQDFTCS